jgi:hypothetical protein
MVSLRLVQLLALSARSAHCSDSVRSFGYFCRRSVLEIGSRCRPPRTVQRAGVAGGLASCLHLSMQFEWRARLYWLKRQMCRCRPVRPDYRARWSCKAHADEPRHRALGPHQFQRQLPEHERAGRAPVPASPRGREVQQPHRRPLRTTRRPHSGTMKRCRCQVRVPAIPAPFMTRYWSVDRHRAVDRLVQVAGDGVLD